MYRLKVNSRLDDFISAIQNATYPNRKENSNNTKPNRTPVHNFTSHYRTSLEYCMLFIIEEDKNNIIKPKKKFIEHANPIT
jgi:dihydroxyacetone kinase-like predicted kinase